MDETTLDSEYLKQLKPSFLYLFMNFVKPCNVISLFHKYNINVLTENDVENIKALSDKKGEREGSMLLFERLVLYKGWYACLLQVLRDRDACLSHVAHEMEVIKGLLDEKILSEESEDQTQTTVQWLAGMSVLTSGLTTVLRVPPHTPNLNKLKVDSILEMRSLKLKIELERLKKELEEVKQNLMERNQSFEQQHLEANSVLSDSSDVDQLAGKMCEVCKSSKEMLKKNEILQTELRGAYSDSMAFSEKLIQEKEVLQTELDHLKKEFSDRKDSYEKLQQETEKLQTELDHLKMEFSDRKDTYEKLQQEKEKLQTELDHVKMEFSDRKDSYEKLHQEKENDKNKHKQQENIMREMECALQQCAVEKEKLEEKLKAYRQESNELQNKLEACHRGELEKAELAEKLKAYHDENAELKNKLEASHQDACTHKTMATDQRRMLESEEAKNKQMLLKNQTLENSVKEIKLEKSNLEEKLKGSDQARCAAEKKVSDLKKELATIEIPSGKKRQLERLLDFNRHLIHYPIGRSINK